MPTTSEALLAPAEAADSQRSRGTVPGVNVGLAESDRDLHGILSLQRASRRETEDGFVTVVHTIEILQKMHALAPSIVARDAQGEVVAYALVMTHEARPMLPILEPMFALLETMPPGSLPPRWYVMGQVAVAASHRGSGVFDALYREHRARYRDRFDGVITEVATRNKRSMRAHERVGFRTIRIYRDATDEWAVIAWDFPT